MVNASFEADAKANDKGYWGGFVDTLSIAGHGLVNFGGGAVNALADTVDLVVDVVQTTFNAVSPTCWTKTFCAAIPNIPSVPIYGDPALYKYSQTAGYATTVAVEFVATGGLGMVADGFSATVTAAKALPRLVTELPAVVNDVKSVVKAVVPAVKALVPRLPGLIKTTVTGVADNAASLVKNPGAFLSDLKTGLSNPLTTKGGVFGTPASSAATTAADADTVAASVSNSPLRANVGLEEQVAGCVGGSCSLADYADLHAARANLEQIDGALSDAPNAEMLRRTETAVSEGTDLTSGQRNFLDHEVLEGQLIADGVPQEVAHVVVLDVLPPGSNYDLDVLQRYSDQFNSSQFRYWGAEHPRGMP